MSTQAQAQHCKEYMQPVRINTQATLVLPKHIAELFKKKLITTEENGSGVNQGGQEFANSHQERTSSGASVRSSLDVRALYITVKGILFQWLQLHDCLDLLSTLHWGKIAPRLSMESSLN
ncbi:hypothetical protein BPAE_0003g00820 [Botrytis paeoniae]|uniref:Uncharacterized protein n=1 Tax=Botrytis paeoniae TaxID=278948 RepID=A0A4Z1G9U9_9HELO|nr:hypothetical protein BPAE_0003g00820 [Botrytis paeoniae]